MSVGERFAATALLAVPVAVCEEAVFRGLLTPRRIESSAERLGVAAALAVFVGWHVVQGAVWPAARRVFWRADFLAATAVLGAACTALRLRSGSLVPGVVLHAAAIVAWRTLFGGPTVSALRTAR